ncbi:hypothetical protein CYY_000716 [Polysphondylium violaceum]|uniref:FZ domain-containing protein n=1 Tax=Polysphondylium violaceum TaxID=133409 RepID=A0A8J4Q3B9_9MYCE|nr:hypothetical protein CYY_000716 [Polysphondylium violaceum]
MKSFVLLSLMIICSIFTATHGHAVLRTPQPWNTQASKANPCGGGNPNTTPRISYCPGTKATVVWEVQVGDGTGPVTFKLSTTHDVTKFDTALTSTGATPNAVGTYSFQVDIPNTSCQDGLCYIQAYSDSNWFSCASINITPDCKATELALVPIEIEDLPYCNMVNKRTVLLPPGITNKDQFVARDATALSTFKQYMNNSAVIGTPSATCGNLLTEFICDQSFPLAPGSDGAQVTQVCAETCTEFKEVCQVVSHDALYPCANYPKCSDAFKQLPSLFILFFIVIVSVLVL